MGLTTLSLSGSIVWKCCLPQPPEALRACPDLYTDCFYVTASQELLGIYRLAVITSLREEVCLRVPHMCIEMCVIIRLGLSEPSNMRALYRTGLTDSVCTLLSHSKWRY